MRACGSLLVVQVALLVTLPPPLCCVVSSTCTTQAAIYRWQAHGESWKLARHVSKGKQHLHVLSLSLFLCYLINPLSTNKSPNCPCRGVGSKSLRDVWRRKRAAAAVAVGPGEREKHYYTCLTRGRELRRGEKLTFLSIKTSTLCAK